ncbi:MAG: hypothetical protein ACRD3E_13375, partial [Terriglobales bacterium]
LATLSAIFFAVLIAAAVLPQVVRGSSSDSDCKCPEFDAHKHGRVETLIDKELSSSEKLPASGDLIYPKTLTVCMYIDQSNKVYPNDLRLMFEGSLDGRYWYPLTLAGTNTRVEGINGCVQATPARYVRTGWGPGTTIGPPGPHVTVQVQASY